MRAYCAAMLLGGALALSSVGCGHSKSDGSGGASGSSGSPGTSSQFIAQLCAEFSDCCKAAGRPSDGAQCRAFYGAFTLGATYDAAAADGCLAEVRGAGANKCAAASMNTPSCSKVFASSGGSKKPGETCQDSSECAPADSGHVDCVTDFVNNASIQQCQLQLPGTAGSSPCVATVKGNVTYYSSSGDGIAAMGYVCDIADGLTCDGQTKACVALGTTGQPCASGGLQACVTAAYCTFPDDVCKDRVALGATCESDDACQVGDYCEPTSNTCAAQHAPGETCTTTAECQFGNCTNQKCGASDDFALALLCGGN